MSSPLARLTAAQAALDAEVAATVAASRPSMARMVAEVLSAVKGAKSHDEAHAAIVEAARTGSVPGRLSRLLTRSSLSAVANGRRSL